MTNYWGIGGILGLSGDNYGNLKDVSVTTKAKPKPRVTIHNATNLLYNLFMHYQVGRNKPFYLDASTLDFSNTSQEALGLTGMKVGEAKGINLFNSGINQNSLAFGKVTMIYQGGNQFSIIRDYFDFDYQSTSSFGRNAGTFIGGALFGQFFNTPATPGAVFRNETGLGGPFYIDFTGTATIPSKDINPYSQKNIQNYILQNGIDPMYDL